MPCRACEHSFAERNSGIGSTRLCAVLTLGLRWALDEILAAIATPIVRAQWQHLLGSLASGRQVGALTSGGEDARADVRGHLRVVYYEEEDPAILNFPAHLLSDHTLNDGSGHGAA